MKDRFKQRIDDSRKDWEVYEADLESLWENIESKIDDTAQENNAKKVKIWLKIAASIALLAVIGWSVMATVRLEQQEQTLTALRDISPDLAETELYYASQISETLRLIHASNADVDEFILEDLAILDSAYHELQLDLRDNVDNEEVISAMIQNYRIKLQILEQILSEVRTKEEDNEREEVII